MNILDCSNPEPMVSAGGSGRLSIQWLMQCSIIDKKNAVSQTSYHSTILAIIIFWPYFFIS